MQLVLIAAISLHLLAGTFWAGTSFTLARTGGAGAEALFRPQMGAAVVAVLAGGYLWSRLHIGVFGTPEQLLAAGAIAAGIAAGVQGALCGPAIRRLRSGSEDTRGPWADRSWSAPRSRAARAGDHLHGGGALCLSRIASSSAGWRW